MEILYKIPNFILHILFLHLFNQKILIAMTTENNKLIAEFMGLTIITDNISYFDTNYKALKNYHSDWNCLMEVVERIESLGNDVLITTNYIQIAFDEGEQFIIEEVNIKIEAVYDACIEFIKWHSQQK